MHYHDGRTASWGHWGIHFLDPQPDKTLNFGVIVATVYFPVGACGPMDGHVGSPTREAYRTMCRAWVERRELPADAVRTAP